MSSPGLLQGSLELKACGGGVYERECDRTWWGHDAMFGGYVEALMLRAMVDELADPSMLPQSIAAHFLRPFSDGLLRCEVTLERRGRTMANLSVRAFSGGKLSGLAIANFGRRRRVLEFFDGAPPSEMTPIGADELPSDRTFVPTHDHYEFYPRIGTFERGEGISRVGGWLRQRHPGPIDAYLMFVLSDVWMPAAYHRWTASAPAVSADITTHFRAEFPRHDLDPAAPLFVELTTTGSFGGFVDEDVTIWSSTGELLSQSRQMRFIHAPSAH